MHLELGYIARHDAEGRQFEPTDEALIFIEGGEPDDEGNNCIHVRCEGAKEIARKIIASFNAGRA